MQGSFLLEDGLKNRSAIYIAPRQVCVCVCYLRVRVARASDAALSSHLCRVQKAARP